MQLMGSESEDSVTLLNLLNILVFGTLSDEICVYCIIICPFNDSRT